MESNKRKPKQQPRTLAAPGAKYVECICPTCKKKHKVKMLWTGGKKITPRKYCNQCRGPAKNWNTDEIKPD